MLQIYLEHDLIDRQTDWRQPELQIVPRFDEARARVAGIERGDVYQSLAFATLGVQVGLFRDADKILPIVARAPGDERLDVRALPGSYGLEPGATVSHSHVADRVEFSSWFPEDSMIYRRNRVRTITARANAPVGHNPTHVFEMIRPIVEAIDLPPGYALEWGGEFESSARANRVLVEEDPADFRCDVLHHHFDVWQAAPADCDLAYGADDCVRCCHQLAGN